jgi:uncharacterized damage-inducible protein DinB
VSKLDIVRHLFEYNEWANNHLLSFAEALPEAELTAARGGSFPSMLETFGHLAAAQINWLERWTTGANRVSTLELQKMPDIGTVRAAFLASHMGLREFLSGLQEEELAAPRETRDSAGQPLVRPFWQMMTHVANHGTFHRGEVALMLTELGHSPGDIDFLYWEVANHP